MPIPWTLLALLALIVVYDVVQRRHAILRNFPILGHFRYLLESVGPELRQYIVTDNNSERPFSRDERSWVYASAKKQNNYFGFGTDNELEEVENYLIIKQTAFPVHDPHPGEPGYDDHYTIPCAKVLGGARGRAKAFRPRSLVNTSAMSYGSLSSAAVEAINRGAALAGCLHNTGEGGVSAHHQHGGELIWQIGTGYFGCRDGEGRFDREKFLRVVEENPQIKAIEIKLSQGAKPGLGGVLPVKKITPEIARIRGIPRDRDCISPSSHSAFRDVDSMLDFVEDLADATGLPVGIKSAVGLLDFWHELAEEMVKGERGVDYIAIDGGEGGTGAAPLSFSDHVSLPFKVAFSRVYPIFAERGIDQNVVFIGSGKLGFPERALFAFALGCDMIAVGREAMLAVGCIQAQRCHTDHCPTGVATQNRWLVRGLVPSLKAARFANYVITLRKELLRLSRACGVVHPGLVTGRYMEVLNGRFHAESVCKLFGYGDDWCLPSDDDRKAIEGIMAAVVDDPAESEGHETAA